GPYVINEANGLTLDASASKDLDGDPLTYSWTINGHANAASGVNSTLTWSQLQALGLGESPTPFSVSVLVDDGCGFPSSANTTVTVSDPAVLAHGGLVLHYNAGSNEHEADDNDAHGNDRE